MASLDLQELVDTLQETSSFKSNKLDYENDPPEYEYPDSDMLIPANSEIDAAEYDPTLELPELSNLIEPRFGGVVLDATDSLSYISASTPDRSLVAEFPHVAYEGRLRSLEILTDLFKALDTPLSYFQFWVYDILTECLMYAQDCPELNAVSQTVIVRFLVMFMRDVRIRQLDLCGIMKHLKLRILSYQKKVLSNDVDESIVTEGYSEQASTSIEFDESIDGELEGSFMSLTKSDTDEVFFVLDYIYNKFGNTFSYQVLQMAMVEPQVVEHQTLNYRVEFPKNYLPASLEKPVTAKEAKARKKAFKKIKKQREKIIGKDSSSDSGDDSADFELMELEEIRQEKMKSYILPLKMAVGKDFYTNVFKKAAEEDALKKKEEKEKKKKDKKKKKK